MREKLCRSSQRKESSGAAETGRLPDRVKALRVRLLATRFKGLGFRIFGFRV